ncbi:Rho termination factor N-terminal domain-containing protein [Clostridium sp. CX1]|uniref:Rho termination factor N-terminal domain-containing protein n=1 Tax=Clostridium sp. CX1 TaxID=2978346 RepID=UPI0021BF2E61|nr:Rho termination factor N-terminal domain-containing protein [Clostridium sp. CX1]MCT8975500.1 Rho termination factor N-terminal domain-containing protein [Clostridium sp. CX1]
MVILKALNPVFLSGRIIQEGDKFSCPPDFAKKLIENQCAVSLTAQDNGQHRELESMTKAELLKLVEERDIEGIDDSNKKAEIIDAILKAVN